MVATIATPSSSQSSKCKRIVLVGNPNVGKSALFTALTGTPAEVSNFPGTTTDLERGTLGGHEVLDTPGIYGVSSFNEEERLARATILSADTIINVVSALSLERDLFLTLQLLDMGKPVIVALNQFDEALEREIKIDLNALSEALRVPVVATVAVCGQGIDELRSLLPQAHSGVASKLVLSRIQSLLRTNVDQDQAVLIAEGDEESAVSCGTKSLGFRNELYLERRRRVNELVQIVVKQPERKKRISTAIGRMLLNPLYGGIISALVCYLLFYQMLGVFVAGNVVDFTEKKVMRVYCEPAIRRLVALTFPSTVKVGDNIYDFPSGSLFAGKLNQDFERACASTSADKISYDFWSHQNLAAACGNTLAGEYGILTLTMTYLIGLLFPLVLAFYFGLSLLEDSGYLPRLAVLVDRLLNGVGLTGRAIIPLILGLGCVTVATITTRLLCTKREKIIATALLGVAIPCSAQLGIVSGTLAKSGGLLPWITYGGVIAAMLVIAGLFLNKILPGEQGGLIIDLPPMRFPRLNNVLKKTWRKTWDFVVESAPMFCLAGLVVSAGQMTGLLDRMIEGLTPVTVGLLHLPDDPRIPTTFILGIVRRDFAAFGLTDVALNPVQTVVSMVVITLFVPCIAAVGVMIKERGAKTALTIWFASWAFAIAVGTLLALILPPLFKAIHI